MHIPDTMIHVALPITAHLEALLIHYEMGASLKHVHGTPTPQLELVIALEPEHFKPLVEGLEQGYQISEEMIREAFQHNMSFKIVHRATNICVNIYPLQDRGFR